MAESKELLTDLLRDVSRSFYKTLRVLPGKIRSQIGTAYLLARTTDTIADTELVPLDARLAALHALRDRIMGGAGAELQIAALAQNQGSPAERHLLERIPESLGLLQTFAPDDLGLIRSVLDTICSGQELDLRRFAGAGSGHVVALGTDNELDDYTYRVAGCVGEFWTKICRAHLFPKASLDDKTLLAQGVRFGKGLQLTNILRDVAADTRRGRCYLPSEKLAEASLKPADLLDHATEPRLRPIYDSYIDRAEAHLSAGWSYTTTLPRGSVRVRLACAWPILIGIKTLSLLRTANILDPAQVLKVSRRDVRQIMVRSLFYYPFPSAWRGLVKTTDISKT